MPLLYHREAFSQAHAGTSFEAPAGYHAQVQEYFAISFHEIQLYILNYLNGLTNDTAISLVSVLSKYVVQLYLIVPVLNEGYFSIKRLGNTGQGHEGRVRPAAFQPGDGSLLKPYPVSQFGLGQVFLDAQLD